eukprot:CAMPEP_0113720338 /NCGR_PEP_ID=MMETSP0038_2-20120614/36405_1 /TAXON_ID=2898 /ORGANISM="Cryptomonas paramecium" /LENGTH=83 /DNA_ID=CAMNT_0000648991 /DNA_START=172 /DNA_END=420 /DNA_ORIENTATION=- /assembly_acc=CAM_ASM_000170
MILEQIRSVGQNCSSKLAGVQRFLTNTDCYEQWRPSYEDGRATLQQYTVATTTRFTLPECAAACSSSATCSRMVLAETSNSLG